MVSVSGGGLPNICRGPVGPCDTGCRRAGISGGGGDPSDGQNGQRLVVRHHRGQDRMVPCGFCQGEFVCLLYVIFVPYVSPGWLRLYLDLDKISVKLYKYKTL